MTFRPTGYTSWAAGATNIAEPTDVKKNVGWGINEQPASSYFNWLSNKVDSWRSYFDWATSLRPVVEDDFVRAIASGGGSGTISPMWTSASGGWLLTEATDAPGTLQFFGALNGGAAVDFYTRIGSLNDRDFRLELITKYVQRVGGETGYFFYGAIGHYGFAATGPSANYAFLYTPSGRGTTSIDLGVDPISTTYKKLVAERHGATLGVFIDDILRASIPGVMMGATAMKLGGQHVSATVLDTVNNSIDRIGLWRKV